MLHEQGGCLRETNKFGAFAIKTATKSLVTFCNEVENCEFLMIFLALGNFHINKNKKYAKEQIINIFQDDSNKVSNQLVEFLKVSNIDHLFNNKTYERFFGQMSFARSIDNFISYFKDILSEIVLINPNILKSKEKERLDFILSFESLSDLHKAISEKKIEELFYKGIYDIEKFFVDRLGIILFKNEEDKNGINYIIKQRNLIVHNRGKISKEFIAEFPERKHTAGLYLFYTYEDISLLNLQLQNFLVDLDEEISKKFKLEVTSC